MPEAEWVSWNDEMLLGLRLCDLELSIAGTDLEQRIAQVNAELEARKLVLPRYWLSDEWFTPDGIVGVAIPFYLAHPRLAKLEYDQMLEVEGGSAESCHENPAPRGGTRHRQRLPTPTAPDETADLRYACDAVPRVLHASAAQQELRPAS